MTPLLIVLVPGLLWIGLVIRISAYRKDRLGSQGSLTNRVDSTWLLTDVLTAENYTPEGRRLLPWLKLTLVALVVAAILALGLLA